MELINDFLPLLIPLFVVQFALAIVALVHVLRHPKYRFGNKIMWIIIVLMLSLIGPIIYFVIGRGEEQ